jgi:hypothetical protein
MSERLMQIKHIPPPRFDGSQSKVRQILNKCTDRKIEDADYKG